MVDKKESLFREIEVPLPQKGARLFGSGEDWQLNACLHYVPLDWEWDWYADGYKRAADLLVEYVGRTHADQDILVYPVVFLYRHYLEVRLKELYIVASQYLSEPVAEVPPDHDLLKLWALVRPKLEKVWPEGEYHDDVEAILKQFCGVDVGSYAFRYPVNKDGTPSLEEVGHHINLGRVRDTIAGVATILNGSSIGLSEYLQVKREMEAEAYQEAMQYAEPPDY